jgi:CRISPR/Cas system CSM-associated protein Csm3 (group 7 of RAMP superfamily)
VTESAHYPLRYLARVVIEFETPFIIGAGSDDLFFDDVFAADANGLPALPGSSLAGILRHGWADAGYGDGNDLFGFQKDGEGRGSRLSVSWGCIHDRLNSPVEGIVTDIAKLAADEVLAESRLMSARDHVCIGHKGAAAGPGKFDERSVSAGHRFSFELELTGKGSDRDDWLRLMTLLQSESIVIGGKTRRGYGQFRVVSLREGCFDLSEKGGFDAYSALPVSLAEACTLPEIAAAELPQLASVAARLSLQPEAFWMIGGGYDAEVDMAPLRANRIVWRQGSGSVERDRVVVPGSALKGALAHRVAFHYNRLTGRFAAAGVDPEAHTGVNNKAVSQLFGFCKGSLGAAPEGRRGRVIIGDLFVDEPGEQKVLNHVSLDRFTGGARTLEGALFDEKPFYRGPGFSVTVQLTEADRIEGPQVRLALDAALRDLAEGRLAIGAGSGRGNGYFRAEQGVQWNEAGTAWLAGGVQ